MRRALLALLLVTSSPTRPGRRWSSRWLLYSGNWFNQSVYGIGIAECDGSAGPCRKPLDRPWLGSNAQGRGPGEASLFRDGDGWWIVYGPWAVEYEEQTPRPAAVARVGFGPTGPYLAEPPA